MYAVVDAQGFVNELNEDDNTEGPATVTWRRFWMISPAAGDTLVQGKPRAVSWNSTLPLAEKVKIELSTDGGGTWSVLAEDLANDGSHVWDVMCGASGQCLLRIGDEPATVSDETDGVFTVAAPMDLLGGGCAPPPAPRTTGGLPRDGTGVALLLVPAGAAALLLSRRRRVPRLRPR